MGSYTVMADTDKNVLRVEFVGYFNDEEATRACELVLEEAAKLRTGFSIITDISEFMAASEGGAEEIKRIQGALGNMGVSQVIRVVGARATAALQLTRTAREAGYGPGAEPVSVKTQEEAEALLKG
jgi:hypothetical protein